MNIFIILKLISAIYLCLLCCLGFKFNLDLVEIKTAYPLDESSSYFLFFSSMDFIYFLFSIVSISLFMDCFKIIRFIPFRIFANILSLICITIILLRTLDPTWFDIIANDIKIIENRKTLWGDVYSLTAKNLYSYEVFGPLNEFNLFTQNKVTETLIFLTDDFFKHTTLTKIKESAVKAANSDILTLLDQLLKSHAKPTTFFNSSLVLGVVAIVAVVAIAAAFIYFSKVPSTSDITELSKNIDDDISSINTNLTELKTTITNVETGLDLNKTSIAENFTTLDNKINESVVDLPTLKTTVTNMDGALKYNTKKITENFTTLDNKINEVLEDLQKRLSQASIDINTGLGGAELKTTNLKEELLAAIDAGEKESHNNIFKQLKQASTNFEEIRIEMDEWDVSLTALEKHVNEKISPRVNALVDAVGKLQDLAALPTTPTTGRTDLIITLADRVRAHEVSLTVMNDRMNYYKSLINRMLEYISNSKNPVHLTSAKRLEDVETNLHILMQHAPQEVRAAAVELRAPIPTQEIANLTFEAKLEVIDKVLSLLQQ